MSNLTVKEINDVLVVDSRLLADELGIVHKNLLGNIRKYLIEIEQFGRVLFETQPLQTAGGEQLQSFCYLNEDQAIFVMTLSRNTEKVIKCKANLVKAFKQAKEMLRTVTQPPVRELPQHTAVEYAQALIGLEQTPDSLLKQLIKDAMIDELSLNQNLKYLPVAEKPKQYTIVKVRAKQLGYSDKEIGDGKQLGKFVKSQVTPSFQEMIGRYPVFHYEINEHLDRAIHQFFN